MAGLRLDTPDAEEDKDLRGLGPLSIMAGLSSQADARPVSTGGLRQMPWAGGAPDPLQNPAVVRAMMEGIVDPDAKWWAFMGAATAPTASGHASEAMARAFNAFGEAKFKEAELKARYMPVVANALLSSQIARYNQMEKQQSLNKQWNDLVVGRLTAQLRTPEPPDPMRASQDVMDLIIKGLVPPDLGIMYIRQLPQDPNQLRRYLENLSVAALDPQQRVNAVFPERKEVSTGNQTVFATPGREGLSPPRVGGALPHGVPPQPPRIEATDIGPAVVHPESGRAGVVNTPEAAAAAASGVSPRPNTPPAIIPPASGPATIPTASPGGAPAAATPPPGGAAPGFGGFADPTGAPAGAESAPAAADKKPVTASGVELPPIPRVGAGQLTAGAPGPFKLNPITVEVQKKAADEFVKDTDALATVLQAQRDALKRAATIRDLATKVRTGKLAEIRADAAGLVRDLLVSTGILDENKGRALADKIAGGNLAALEQLRKLAVSGAMTNLRADIGSAGSQRIAMQEFMQYLQAVANPNLDPRTLEGLWQDVMHGYQRDSLEMEARSAFLRTPNADFTQFQEYWNNLAQKAKQVPVKTSAGAGRGAGVGAPDEYVWSRSRSGRVIFSTPERLKKNPRDWSYPNEYILMKQLGGNE